MRPEDGSGDIVVRLYESMQMHTRCTLLTPLPIAKAMLTTMLEENGRSLPAKKRRLALEFRPFEIKTVRLVLR
jgi:alpha-mannosidase